MYDQIWVKTTKSEKTTYTYCYKKEHFLTKGWCRPIDWQHNDGDGGWGICTESCKYLKNFVDTTSAVNKKAVQKVGKNTVNSIFNLEIKEFSLK